MFSSDSIVELYKKLAGSTKLSVHRLRVTKVSDGSALPPAMEKKSTVGDVGLSDGDTVVVKDLGEPSPSSLLMGLHT